jgi:hypothetical protein
MHPENIFISEMFSFLIFRQGQKNLKTGKSFTKQEQCANCVGEHPNEISLEESELCRDSKNKEHKLAISIIDWCFED